MEIKSCQCHNKVINQSINQNVSILINVMNSCLTPFVQTLVKIVQTPSKNSLFVL